MLREIEVKEEFDLSKDEGKEKMNRFIAELYTMFYFFDEDDFSSRFVELSTQYPYVFNNFANNYINERQFAELNILGTQSKTNYIIIDKDLFIDANIKDYVGEEALLRKYIFNGSYEELLDFESEYLYLKFKRSGR